MKKLFSSIMMAAAALFITSCASDDMTSSQTGEKAEVTFALGLEDGIGTRAISDGTGANYLAYAVFNADGTILEDYKKQGEAVTFPVQKTLTLAKDKTYKIVFWAQNSACTAYTVSDDMKVTVDYAGINNDETRDAFFKTVEFTVKGAAQIDVELQRALAQINVGVTAADWEAAKKSGVTIEKSVAYIKQAATSVDLLTGKASDPVEVTYTENAIPAEDLVVDGETYKWLSMSYILVADGTETGTEKATLNDLGFSFNYTGGAVEFKSGLTSVPVQRNYRTNIVGKLLTGDVNFNITVDNIYAGNHAYPETVEQQLAMAAAVGGAVTLTEDVTLTKPLAVNSDMIINLNGKTISYTSDVADHNAMITVNRGKSLVIDDALGTGKVSYTYNGAGDSTFGWGSYAIANNGTLVVENGTVEMLCDINVTAAKHMYCAIHQGGDAKSSTTINGGKVSCPTYRSIRINQGSLTINDGVMEGQVWMHPFADNTSIEINGGSFAPRGIDGSSVFVENSTKTVILKVTAGTFETKIGSADVTKTGVKGSVAGGVFGSEPNSDLIAAGYKSVKMGDKWYVIPAEYDMVISTAADLQAFANEVNVNGNTFNGKTVVLGADIDLAGIDWEPIGQTYTNTFNGVFDGMNHTISNISIDSEAETGGHYSSGLFGWVESHSANHGIIKNVKINGATVKGHHNCGALVGYITEKYALVENCHVTGASISCTNANADANGDKAGALIGNATVATTVKDCTASNSTVSAGRDAGQVMGAGKSANVTGCSATNVTVTANGTGTGNNIKEAVIGREL